MTMRQAVGTESPDVALTSNAPTAIGFFTCIVVKRTGQNRVQVVKNGQPGQNGQMLVKTVKYEVKRFKMVKLSNSGERRLETALHGGLLVLAVVLAHVQ